MAVSSLGFTFVSYTSDLELNKWQPRNAKMNKKEKQKPGKIFEAKRPGKIEILGKLGDEMLFKYHQSKYPENDERLFAMKLRPDQCWLEDIPGWEGHM